MAGHHHHIHHKPSALSYEDPQRRPRPPQTDPQIRVLEPTFSFDPNLVHHLPLEHHPVHNHPSDFRLGLDFDPTSWLNDDLSHVLQQQQQQMQPPTTATTASHCGASIPANFPVTTVAASGIICTDECRPCDGDQCADACNDDDCAALQRDPCHCEGELELCDRPNCDIPEVCNSPEECCTGCDEVGCDGPGCFDACQSCKEVECNDPTCTKDACEEVLVDRRPWDGYFRQHQQGKASASTSAGHVGGLQSHLMKVNATRGTKRLHVPEPSAPPLRRPSDGLISLNTLSLQSPTGAFPPPQSSNHINGPFGAGGFTQLSYVTPADFSMSADVARRSPRIPADEVPSPSKRRRTSSIATTMHTERSSSNGYSTAPSSVSPQPLGHTIGGFSCHWDTTSCEASFLDQFGLENHIRETHSNSLDDGICHWDHCGTKYTDPQTFFSHLSYNHLLHPPTKLIDSTPKHVCLWGNCNETFANEDDLQEHINQDHLKVDEVMQCKWDSCGTQIKTDYQMFEHIHKEHVHPNCEDHQHIEKLIPNDSHHIRTPALSSAPNMSLDSTRESSPIKSDSPASVWTPGSSTATPVAGSSSSGPKRCEWQEEVNGVTRTCGLEFPSANDLHQHAKDMHIAVLKKKTGYYCRWAGCNRQEKAFSQKGKVDRHLQTHTGYKSCTCETCGKEFSAPQALEQHKRTHTGEKPYRCDVCGKDFAQGSAMTMHRRTHTGERPLMCDFPGCGKRFSESSNLSKHRKTHNPEGKHRCQFPGCAKSFHRLDQMKRHAKTHGDAVIDANGNLQLNM